jgi:hypothetical protein
MNLLKRNAKTITLKKYKLIFKTVDGEMHELNHIKPIDETAINCSALDYFLIYYNKFLEDDEGVHYPIENIISIKFELNGTISNVKQKEEKYGFPEVYYSQDDIEIIKEKE